MLRVWTSPTNISCVCVFNSKKSTGLFMCQIFLGNCKLKLKAWDSAAAIARAFAIGKFESAAIHNLQSKVQPDVVSALKEVVRVRGMRGFLQHETLAKDLFNRGFTSGVASLEVWCTQLMNKDDNELVPGTNCCLFFWLALVVWGFRLGFSCESG